MSGLRFASSSSNDKRVRIQPCDPSSFPGSGKLTIYALTPGERDVGGAPQAEIHITTPKRTRKEPHIPKWTLFSVSRDSDNDTNVSSQPCKSQAASSGKYTRHRDGEASHHQSPTAPNEQSTRSRDEKTKQCHSQTLFTKQPSRSIEGEVRLMEAPVHWGEDIGVGKSGKSGKHNLLRQRTGSKDCEESKMETSVTDDARGVGKGYGKRNQIRRQPRLNDCEVDKMDTDVDMVDINSRHRCVEGNEDSLQKDLGNVNVVLTLQGNNAERDLCDETWVQKTNDSQISKCPVMTFYKTFGGSTSTDDLSEVSEEEVNSLPDIGRHVNNTKSKDKTPDQSSKQNKSAKPSKLKLAIPEPSPGNKPPLEKTPVEDKKKFFDRQHMLYKSLSVSYIQMDEEKVESFFGAIKDSNTNNYDRYQQHDPAISEEDPRDSLNTNSSLDCEIMEDCPKPNRKRSAAMFSCRRAWSCRDDLDICDMSTSTLAPSRSSGEVCSRTPVEELLLHPLDDGQCPDRLLSRRFALADPERMIMSQSMREALERDVFKRRSSVVRKFSQFFNVKMGLNKEEDLI